MAEEIEHKYLVHLGLWRPADAGTPYRQGYLTQGKERVVRVRIAGDSAFLTIKGATNGISRLEFEYPIPEGSTRMAEIAKMAQYCRTALLS